MVVHSMVGDDASFCLAEECVQLCSEEERAEDSPSLQLMSCSARKNISPRRLFRNEGCVREDVFKDGHVNCWQIIDLVPKSGSNPEEIEQAPTMVLKIIAAKHAKEIKKRNVGAFMTSDPATDGYYLVH
jgi:hypothetical protein